MPRIARSLVWPNLDEIEKWKEIVLAVAGNSQILRGDIEEDFVKDMSYRIVRQHRQITEKQAKWLWDIYGRL